MKTKTKKTKKSKKNSNLSIVLDGEVYFKEGNKKEVVDPEVVLQLVYVALVQGMESMGALTEREALRAILTVPKAEDLHD